MVKKDMKLLAASLFLVGFLMISVFGFALMDHGMSHQAGDCPIAILGNIACLPDAASSIISHIVAFQTFTQAALAPSIGSLAVLLAYALLAIVATAIFRPPVYALRTSHAALRNEDLHEAIATQKFIRWFSLFEHSPSRSCGA